MTINRKEIEEMLAAKKELRRTITMCLACGACRDSCFVYLNSGDIRKSPAAKVDATLGLLFRRRGRVSESEMKKIEEILFHDCQLCRRCYCPLGIDIPGMIAFGRSLCRSQGLEGRKDDEGGS